MDAEWLAMNALPRTELCRFLCLAGLLLEAAHAKPRFVKISGVEGG